MIAPELLVAECANILWQKVERGELLQDEAILAARLLQSADIELAPTRSLFEAATRLAIETHHLAYDCVCLALALANDCRFVTADGRFLRKLGQIRRPALQHAAISLTEAARL